MSLLGLCRWLGGTLILLFLLVFALHKDAEIQTDIWIERPPAEAGSAFYILGGLSLLTMKKWGAVLGILFISAEVLGRVYLVTVGIAPSKGGDAAKIVIGGAIALAVILYVFSQWKKFD